MEFRIRPMEARDLDKTLEWRNDPEVLKSAQTPEPISMKEHESLYVWNNAIKLVFEYDGVSAGYIQFNRDPDVRGGEWSFHMSKEFRGKGLSEIMLKAALYYVAKKEGYIAVTSRVLKSNAISIHLHKKLGFDMVGGDGNFFEYDLALS